ncbi:arginase [Massilia atriviolacea]|uniref:Arginase n=1 Tax=Massilia atriviolacea TaxID=2495579 RepID=A0A430HTG7_9BURK|nr:arginase family protein [Massilia atriviolacea]RSZ60831.1 arginase [Massilia atriviolacea]
MIKPLLVPYLMGQRRDGLRRVAPLRGQPWQVVSAADPGPERIVAKDQQLRSMEAVYARLAAAVRGVLRDGHFPCSLAGDCVSAMGMLAGLQQAGRAPRRILWLDAHGDFHTWGTTQTQYLGGMPLAMLVGRPDRRGEQRDAIASLRNALGVRPYPERRVVLSDARDLDPGEDQALRRSAIVHCPLDAVLSHLHPQESLYVHFDTDVLDEPLRMPALKYHVPGGPRLEQMAQLFDRLRGYRLVALSVSAWHAEQDEDGQAARACLALIERLLPDSGD